ncbi:hypothetical protein BH09MYX1_BH09MYX1_18420 [soil metagenome]
MLRRTLLAFPLLCACSGGYYAFPDGGRDAASVPDGGTILPDGGEIDAPVTIVDGATADAKPPVGPRFQISEIAPNVSGGGDLVEIRAIDAGSIAGFTVEQDIGAAVVLATLPAINLSVGEILVVYVGGSSVIQSESSSKTSCASSTCYPNAWDVFGGATGITFSGRVIVLRNANKVIVDGTPYYRDGLTSGAGFAAEVMALQKAGAWLPANCNGDPCSTNDLAEPISVSWLGVGTSGAGATIARKGSSDTDRASDWLIGPSSLGDPNP